MISFHTSFTTTIEDREAFIAILSESALSMDTNDDCQMYMIHKDATDETVTSVTEVWKNEAAHEASLHTSEAMMLIMKAMPLLITKPAQQKMVLVGGKGI